MTTERNRAPCTRLVDRLWHQNISTTGNQLANTPPKIIVTPVIFVTFLFSLLLVDLRYSVERSRFHSHSRADTPTFLPAWLHRLIYRPQTPQYYRTKQKKLMRMEAEEAFRMRNSMLLALALVAAAASGAVLYVATRLYRHFLHPLLAA